MKRERDKKRFLLRGRKYDDPEKLDIVMPESAVYLGMRNDLAFIIDMRLYLFEHQSTVNKDMPLRFLQYVSAEYEKVVVSKNLHKRALVEIPAPHFIVSYNGTEKQIKEQNNENILRKWLELVDSAGSIEEFQRGM